MRHAPQILAAVAAAQGAAGAALAAAAAHVANSANVSTASLFLLTHAPAGLALAALAGVGPLRSRALAYAGFALQAGVTLFALDLAMRGLGPGRLFPYAAPIGGSITILSWLALAAIALFTRTRD